MTYESTAEWSRSFGGKLEIWQPQETAAGPSGPGLWIRKLLRSFHWTDSVTDRLPGAARDVHVVLLDFEENEASRVRHRA